MIKNNGDDFGLRRFGAGVGGALKIDRLDIDGSDDYPGAAAQNLLHELGIQAQR